MIRQQVADIAASRDSCAMKASVGGGAGEGVGAEMHQDGECHAGIGLGGREYVPVVREQTVGLDEVLFIKNNVKVGMENVKRLLVGQAEMYKANWTESSLPSISFDHRREDFMLNTTSAMVTNIS